MAKHSVVARKESSKAGSIWDDLTETWKRILFINQAFVGQDKSTIAALLAPSVDHLVTTHNALLGRKLAIPKLVDEATRARAFELPFLACYSSKIDWLGPVEHLQRVEVVNARKNAELVSVAPLARLERLRDLSVLATSVSDLGPLSRCRSLERIAMAATKVVDLGPLTDLTALRSVSFGNTKVADIAPLGAMKDLDNVWMQATPVSSIEPLRGKKRLKTLIAYRTKIHDLSPLETTPDLEWIEIYRTKVSDWSPLLGLKRLKRATIDKSVPSPIVAQLRKLKDCQLYQM